MNPLWEAVYDHAVNAIDTSFIDAVSGRFTYGETLEKGPYPYAVFFGLPAHNSDTFQEKICDLSFQVNIVTDGDYTEAGQILGYCKALFDGKALFVTGYRDITLTREMETPPWKDDCRWIASIQFDGLLQEE
jgi:hypothetical protein